MAALTPLERPACCVCGEPAVICECPELLSGQETVIPLVYRSEPSKPQEGLDLFATYLERHPATRSINVRSFVSDYVKAMHTVEQVTTNIKQKTGRLPNSNKASSKHWSDCRLKRSSFIWSCTMPTLASSNGG